MAELKTREDEHSPIVRKNQLEIVISNLSNEQQNQVSMIGRGISNLSSKIDDIHKERFVQEMTDLTVRI